MAVAVHLLDPAVSATPIAPVESETKESEAKEDSQSNQDAGTNVSQTQVNLRCGALLGDIHRLGFWHFGRWHQLPLLPK